MTSVRPGNVRTPDRWAGSRWAPLAVSCTVIAIVSLYLADALRDAEEASERFVVDVTIRNMRTGMKLAVGEAQIEGRDGEVRTWAGSNPVRWLGTPPTGYLGDCPMDGGLPAGGWCFDSARGELRYRPRHVRWLEVPSAPASKELRWRVVAVSPGTGLRVELITPYTWESR